MVSLVGGLVPFDRIQPLRPVDRLGLLDREPSLRFFGSFRRISLLGPVQPVAAFDDVAPVPQPAGPMAGSFAGRTASTFSWGKVRG